MSGPAGPPARNGRGDDERIRIFVYGTLRSGMSASDLLRGSERLGEATVEGTLYDLGDYPALMLYGNTRVAGELWDGPLELLARLDGYEGVQRGLFRRVAVVASGTPCWTWVAGPALARQLTPERRIAGGRWEPPARTAP